MIKWLRVKFLNWLLQGVTSLSIGEETTSVSAAGVTFGDATVIATANCSVAQPANAIDTIYRNTSGKSRVVCISAVLGNGERCRALIGAATPPTIAVCRVSNDLGYTGMIVPIVFLVPDDYYYELETEVATVTFYYWTEYDLH